MTLVEVLWQHREEYDVDCSSHLGCACGAVERAPGVSEYEDYDRMRKAYVDHLASVITEFLTPKRVQS